MALVIPENVPIATADPSLLKSFGPVFELTKVPMTRAFGLRELSDGTTSLWAHMSYRDYRSLWITASDDGLVDKLDAWGELIDVDHVLARSVAARSGLSTWFIRLCPVWREVNRSAGASREKLAGRITGQAKKAGVIFASELQILKMIGHPVGTASKPEEVFTRLGRGR